MNAKADEQCTVLFLNMSLFRPQGPTEDDVAAAAAAATRAKLHLVDLAGSERQKRSGATGRRLREAVNINQVIFEDELGLVVASRGVNFVL